MKLSINSLYTEVGYSFDISYLIIKKVREQLISDIMQPYGLSKRDEDLFLGLIISTKSTITIVEVKGPEFDKRNGFINYVLWLPYEPIATSSNYIGSFINYLFDSLVLVFSKYDVDENNIRKVQKIIENEVLNNPGSEWLH